MDLRTKLVATLVAVALGSMLAMGWFVYSGGERLMMERTALRLTSLAESTGERVEDVLSGWEEAVRLLASRTQLRRSLQTWNQARSQEEQSRIAQILADAWRTSAVVDGVAVFDPQGGLVAQAGADGPDPFPEPGPDGMLEDGVTLVGFIFDEPPRASYVATLVLDGERVGTLRATLLTEDLSAVAGGRTGLGETGEILIATRDDQGEMRLLTGHLHEIPEERGTSSFSQDLFGAALDGAEGPITENLTDYRGEPIWAAMRRIDPPGLALVLKFDDSEERADIVEYRTLMMGVGFSLSAFAVLLGVLLGFAFARPVQALTEVTERIRGGDMDARADEARQDELGVLGRAFNEMNDELKKRLTELQEFKTFFDESRDMLCIAGVDGYFKRVNPRFEQTLGWSEQQMLERPFYEFIHPDDLEATVAEVDRLSEGIPTISFENRYECADGSYKRLQWSAQPDPETGKLYARARDVSVQK